MQLPEEPTDCYLLTGQAGRKAAAMIDYNKLMADKERLEQSIQVLLNEFTDAHPMIMPDLKILGIQLEMGYGLVISKPKIQLTITL